jgi:hypothetical protein
MNNYMYNEHGIVIVYCIWPPYIGDFHTKKQIQRPLLEAMLSSQQSVSDTQMNRYKDTKQH